MSVYDDLATLFRNIITDIITVNNRCNEQQKSIKALELRIKDLEDKERRDK